MIWQRKRRWLTAFAVVAVLLASVPAAAARGVGSRWIGGTTTNTSGSNANSGIYVIYDDALASGWYDQSWDASVNYRYSRNTFSGRYAISYRATAAWAGLDIRSDSGVDSASYDSLTFSLEASKSNQQYAVYLRDPSGHNLSDPVSLDAYGGQPVTNQWKTYTIPLADLGAANTVIGHVVLHEWRGRAQPAVYVDQIELTSSGQYASTSPDPLLVSPDPSPTPTVTPVPTPSPSPTPVETPSPTPSSTPSPTPVPPPSQAPQTQPISSSGVIWSADTESGNLDQWTQGQYGEAVFNSGTGSVTVSHDVAHSGSTSLKMAISDANGTAQAARIFRWNDPQGNSLPASAYYSVWYYFPQNYTPDQWWNVLQFKSKSSSGQVDPMWVLNVGNRPDGNMYFYLWDAMHSRSYSAAAQVDVPVGRWVHIETYFQRSTGSNGQITIWQDGVKLFDLSGIQTTTFDNQQWSLANYTDRINPSNSVIYADDAAISKNWIP